MKALEEYLQSHPKEIIIFDLDETILELILPWKLWYADLKSLILPKEPELVTLFEKGINNTHETMNAFVKKYGKEAKRSLNEISMNFEKNHLQSIRINHELVELIRKLKGRYRMYIWSSNTAYVVRKSLEEAGIADHFEKIISQLEVDYVKPDPHGFSLIHDGKTDMKNYLFVGDSKSDEGVAKTLGMDFFKVSF